MSNSLKSFSVLRRHRAVVAAVCAAALSLVMAGCGMGTAAPAGAGLGEHGAGGLKGLGYGGQVPIVGGTVYAFVAGKTGYGSPATPLAYAITDSNGSFSFSAGNTIPNAITCPSGSGTLYLYLYGGSGGSTSTNPTANSQSLLMAVVGDCATAVAAQPFVNINEVSTFAAMTAMQGFFNPTASTTTTIDSGTCLGTGSTTTCTTLALGTAENFGTSVTNTVGLANAAATAANLFNTAGNVTGVTTLAGPAGPTLAAISSYSIASDVGNFTTATQSLAPGQIVFLSGFSTSTFLNNQVVTVATATATSFTATLANHVDVGPTTEAGAVNQAATITVTPESAKLLSAANVLATCVNSTGGDGSPCPTLFGAVKPSTSSVTVQDTLQAAYFMATNPMDSSDGTATGTSNMATVFGLITANGKAFAGDLTSAPTDWTLGITYGSTSTTSAGSSSFLLGDPRYIAVDSTGDLWIANAGSANGSLTELSPTGQPLLNTLTSIANARALTLDPFNDAFVSNYGTAADLNTLVLEYTAAGATKTFTTAAGPEAMTADGAGDIFVASTSASGGGNELQLIPSGAASGASLTSLGTFVVSSTTGSSSNSGIAVDSNWNVFVTGGTTAITKISPFAYSSSTTPNWTLGTAAKPGSCYYSIYSLSIDSANNIWGPNVYAGGVTADHALCEFAYVGGTTAFTQTNDFVNAQLVTTARAVLDGNGTTWAASDTAAGGVVEISNTGTTLSPNPGGFPHTYSSSYAIAVDGSGNVWVGNDLTATSTTAGFVTEIVGAATPVITPIAAGLPTTAGGLNRLATRP